MKKTVKVSDSLLGIVARITNFKDFTRFLKLQTFPTIFPNFVDSGLKSSPGRVDFEKHNHLSRFACGDVIALGVPRPIPS